VAVLQHELDQGLDGVSEKEVHSRVARIEQILNTYQRGKKFYAHLYDDVLSLKYMYQRYTNYLRWLLTRS
ncbi:MAG TPA: ATPase, partial [Candidatus Ozemobacteraceae bacterium]|nr:ATPase [Candidatus Ozemobacteraceae bacterium]